MSNPDEALKINRLKKELSASRHLTEVASDFHLFEHATNKHFNSEMNRQQKLDGVVEDVSNLTKRYAVKALDDIKQMLAATTGANNTDAQSPTDDQTKSQQPIKILATSNE